MDEGRSEEVTRAIDAMLHVFKLVRSDESLLALVFVFDAEGAGVGMLGFEHETQAFGLALEAMLGHAENEIDRELRAYRAARPQG